MTAERGSASAGPLSAYLDDLDAPVAAVFAEIVARAVALVPGGEQGRTMILARRDEIDAASATL